MRSIIFVFFLLSTVFSFSHTGAWETKKCPIDGTKVKSFQTMSYTTFGSTVDFQKQGAVGNYYESLIESCPKCHYSTHWFAFDEKIKKNRRDSILAILENYKNDSINEAKECEIAAKLYAYNGETNDVIANCYLVGSYIMKRRDFREDTSYRKLLQLWAAEFFLLAVENNEYEEKETYASIYFLLGELYRRRGDFELAIEYFDTAIEQKKQHDWLKPLAEEQRQMAVDKNEDNSI